MNETVSPSESRPVALAWTAAAVALSVTFLIVAAPALDSLFWDYDEGWFILAARFLRRGMAPFADFIHHQPPLHLYLLALCDRLFGSEIADYRLLSAAGIAASGLLVHFFARAFTGAAPALVAQAVYLFSPAQIYPLCALPETPTVVFILLGALLLFAGTGSWSAVAGAAAFVAALLVKPTSGVAVLAATVSLLVTPDRRRFAVFAAAGIVSGAVALLWLLWVSDGAFAEVLRVQLERAWTRSAGMWSVASGFEDMRRAAGAESRWEWAVHCFAEFFRFPHSYLPMALFAVSVPGALVWALQLARSRPGLAAFSFAWPLAYVALNFLLIDFVAAEKFTPFLAFSAFWIAGLAWLALRRMPAPAAAAVAAAISVALAWHYAATLAGEGDDGYYRHARRLAREHPRFVSFTPMLFAVTGVEPGCGLWNPINTYGRFGEAVGTHETRALRFTDERLVECLRADPSMEVVLDWGFYFYTAPDSPLREYLGGEGAARRVYFSREAERQWGRAVFSMPTDR